MFNGAEINIGDLDIYNFPDIWHHLTFLASFFHLLLGIIIIILIITNF